MKKHTLEEIYKTTRSSGFQCLSSAYVNNKTKLVWQCQYQHIWSAQPNSIANGSGCPYCCGRRKTLQELNQLAQSRGVQFIGSETRYEWKCRNSHVWIARPHVIKNGKTCPVCFAGIGKEEKCRFVFEQLTGKTFCKTRKALGGLELDGYCKELDMAFEYQGQQHYKEHFWHSKNQSFSQQKERDKEKTRLCQELGIRKINIPYYECKNNSMIANYISKRLEIYKNIDWSKFTGGLSQFEKLIKIASKHNFECLSESYLGATTKLSWKCQHGHIWASTPANIKSGYGCPYCSRKAKKTMNDMHDLAQSRGFSFLSVEYTNVMTKHLWACHKGHEWMARPNCIQQGRGCPKCHVKK